MHLFRWLIICAFLSCLSGTSPVWPLWSAYFPRSIVPHGIPAYSAPGFIAFVLMTFGAGHYARELTLARKEA